MRCAACGWQTWGPVAGRLRLVWHRVQQHGKPVYR